MVRSVIDPTDHSIADHIRTVASRALQSSYWPDLLRTDSVRTHGVRKDIVLLTHFGTLMGVLITVAGVVTPLGLYEALVPSSKEQV